ncbi:hypothetical protein [Kitasatospora azatica]|uniref:hypothetical protein n=1 Tax=Kitasatospora azatica TaxID=58347 RepID=UPI0012F7E4EA|nr:hypothetical protein [Kitasatospora azatica]
MSLDVELQELAVQEGLDLDLLRRLVHHPGARRCVARRRDLPVELIEEIISLGAARTIAANSSMPAGMKERLAGHPQPDVRAALAASASDDPPGLLVRLSKDADSMVREFLAMNERLDPQILAGLAVDPEPRVRVLVIEHWRDAPEEVRRAWLTDLEPAVRRAAVHAYPPPSDLLPGLLADPVTRAAAVRRAEPSADMVTDSDVEVRLALADHPALPAGMRDRLAEDSDIFVRNAIAARADTPAAMRDDLVTMLETDDPQLEWFLTFARQPHACPAPTPIPAARTRQQAEELLARAGL